jgi:hypothetical protein
MRTVHLLSIASMAALTACASDKQAAAPALGTGAMLSVDYFADTDVVGFHFEIERVACDADDAFTPFTVTANVDLVDGIFPGMVSLVEQTYDETSRHLGSDMFVSLEAGCYDVLAAPASEIAGDAWSPSADCSSASQAAAAVTDGQTTEITLISQCAGGETGALDTLITLNHPPTICGDDGDGGGEAGSTSGGSDICDGVEIDEKFNYECEPVNVCVTVYDPDDDPIEIVWARESGPSDFALNIGALEVIDFQDGHRIWEQCAEIVTRYTDSYDYSVTIYDLGYSGGSQVRMETLVAPETSQDDLTFPIHTNWIEEPLCYDETDTLVDVPGSDGIDRYAGCSYTTSEQWYCSGAYAVDPDIVAYICDGTTLIEENLYPECPA